MCPGCGQPDCRRGSHGPQRRAGVYVRAPARVHDATARRVTRGSVRRRISRESWRALMIGWRPSALLLGAACTWCDPAGSAGTLRDFGYYWSRSSNDGHFGPGYVWPELAAFANHSTTAIVMNGGPNASAMAHNDILAIQQLRARNMSAILGTPGNVLTVAQRSLQPDYEQRWAEYWRLVHPHSESILAFYPFDEPTVAELDHYETCVKLIRATAATDPSGRPIPIAAVVTPSSVQGIEAGVFDLPKEVDWVGYDNYGCWAEEECEQQGRSARQNLAGADNDNANTSSRRHFQAPGLGFF